VLDYLGRQIIWTSSSSSSNLEVSQRLQSLRLLAGGIVCSYMCVCLLAFFLHLQLLCWLFDWVVLMQRRCKYTSHSLSHSHILVGFVDCPWSKSTFL
jgi:hypothetical protein